MLGNISYIYIYTHTHIYFLSLFCVFRNLLLSIIPSFTVPVFQCISKVLLCFLHITTSCVQIFLFLGFVFHFSGNISSNFLKKGVFTYFQSPYLFWPLFKHSNISEARYSSVFKIILPQNTEGTYFLETILYPKPIWFLVLSLSR